MTAATMRAVVIESADGPLMIREVPIPVPGHDEALVAIGGCAVDRFDLAIRKGVRERVAALPHILGHEIAGTVAAVGAGVENVGVGDRVASTLYLVCGQCRWCRQGRETICENFGGHVGVDIPGGYAEYAVLPARNLAHLPDSIPAVSASIFANAIGTPYHAIMIRMGLGPADRLVITGAGGGVGLHAVQIGVMAGADVLAVDIGLEKLDRCRELGASATVDPTTTDLTSAIREWTGGVGADGVLELVGPATMPSTLAALAKGGKMVIVGSHTGSEWTIDPGDIYRNEWEIKGSRNVTIDELDTVIDLVERGVLTPIIDETGPLEDAQRFHDRVASGSVIGRDVLVP